MSSQQQRRSKFDNKSTTTAKEEEEKEEETEPILDHDNKSKSKSKSSPTTTTTSVDDNDDISKPTLTPTTSTTTSMTWNLYVVIWCIHLSVPLLDNTIFGIGYGPLDSRPLVEWDYLLLIPITMILFVTILAPPTPPSTTATTATENTTTPTSSPSSSSMSVMSWAILAHIIDTIIRIQRMPYIWDHEYWALLMNITFIMSMIVVTVTTTTTTTTTTSLWLQLSRLQFGLLYIAAAVWKINSGFLHNTNGRSCGSVLLVELIGAYATALFGNGSGNSDSDSDSEYMDESSLLSPHLVEWIVTYGPHITIITEFMIGYGMMYVSWYGVNPSSSTSSTSTTIVRDMTVIGAALFHTVIFMMPVNMAGGFSLDCMTRLIVFFDHTELQSVLQPFIDEATTLRQLLFGGTTNNNGNNSDDGGSEATQRQPPQLNTDLKTQFRFWKTAIIPSMMVRVRQLATGAEFDCGFAYALILITLYYFIITESYKQPNNGVPQNGQGDNDNNDGDDKTKIASPPSSKKSKKSSKQSAKKKNQQRPPVVLDKKRQSDQSSVASAVTTKTSNVHYHRVDNDDDDLWMTTHPTLTFMVTFGMLVLTVSYALLCPMFGLTQMGSPTMYANLRTYRNYGNHYIIPTGLLGQHWLYNDHDQNDQNNDDDDNDDNIGLVRVVESNATEINRLLGYIHSKQIFPTHVHHHLRPTSGTRRRTTSSSSSSSTTAESTEENDFDDTGDDNDDDTKDFHIMPFQFFPMCMAMPHARNVLMEEYNISNPIGSTLHTPFIMPLRTIRKALWQDKESGIPFTVQFVDPPYYDYDDNSDIGRQRPVLVEISHDGNRLTTCRVGPTSLVDGSMPTSPWRSCSKKDKLAKALLTRPNNKESRRLKDRVLDKLLLPYPELVGLPDDVCMS